MKRKWRPPLALIIGGTLAAFLSLPLIGIAYFRIEGNILGWGETSWILGWMAVLSTALLAFLLWRLVLRPVWALTDYARALRRGESAVVPPQYGTPEMYALGQSVTDLSEALNARASSLRAYADHVTHELKTPLTTLRGAAEMLQAPTDEDTRAELVRSVDVASARMEQLLGELQRHARATQMTVPGRSLLSEVASGLPVLINDDGHVPLAAEDLATVLGHLVQNAKAHGATLISLTTRPGMLDIVDDGTGIAPGDRARIFDPFFTTRRNEGGTGMGLNIVQSLLQARGAKIELLESVEGAHFRINFPR